MKSFIRLFILVIAAFTLQAEQHKTICLNMIVKNETDVICRCIDSVLPIIDYWVIVDTGSTDGTQDLIRNYMQKKGVPGELYERPWVNFEHNRNEALELARGKGDYVFFIDADEYLVYEPGFELPDLNVDYYYVTITCGGMQYGKVQLINNHLDWEWKGVLHEVICPPPSRTFSTLQKVTNTYTCDGARSKDPLKYTKDIEVLKRELEKKPDDSRYTFYLAQSYLCGREFEKALETYEKRAEMGGFDQEVFWSLYKVGNLHEILGSPEEKIVESYMKAYKYRPSRLEPLYQLAFYYRNKENYEAGYKIAKLGMSIPQTSDILFLQQWQYDYGLALELSICAYWIGKYEECQQICQDLLKRDDLPANYRSCIERNLGFANAKLLEGICQQ